MKTILKITVLLAATVFIHSCAISIKTGSVKKNKENASKTSTKPKPKKDGIKPYSEVITKDAVSDEGLFKVHKIETDFYYEIPDSLFEKEMLSQSHCENSIWYWIWRWKTKHPSFEMAKKR
jgi:hypothetical protein